MSLICSASEIGDGSVALKSRRVVKAKIVVTDETSITIPKIRFSFELKGSLLKKGSDSIASNENNIISPKSLISLVLSVSRERILSMNNKKGTDFSVPYKIVIDNHYYFSYP